MANIILYMEEFTLEYLDDLIIKAGAPIKLANIIGVSRQSIYDTKQRMIKNGGSVKMGIANKAKFDQFYKNPVEYVQSLIDKIESLPKEKREEKIDKRLVSLKNWITDFYMS